MVKSKRLQSFRKKKDIAQLKTKGRSFFYKWLRVIYFLGEEEKLFGAWMIPKKYIPRAVDRNRLRRWGRENLKSSSLKSGEILVLFGSKEKGFYKILKREEFNNVFKLVMEKIYKEHK